MQDVGKHAGLADAVRNNRPGGAVRRIHQLGRVLVGLWAQLGLTIQFMAIVTLIAWIVSLTTVYAERHIARTTVAETSLEMEQFIFHSIVGPIVQDLRGDDLRDAATLDRLQRAFEAVVEQDVVDGVKIWDISGRQILNSLGPVDPEILDESAVLRALSRETVVTIVEESSSENRHDSWAADEIYEVYMPLYGADGVVIGVGEIYYSIDLMRDRIEGLVTRIDRIRALGFGFGILLLGALFYVAQRQLGHRDAALKQSLAEQRDLCARNEDLLRLSESLRQRVTVANEQLMAQIGAELHDGPIQLMSLSSLYAGQMQIAPEQERMFAKCRELTAHAIEELRNISVGLVLPDVRDGSLDSAALGALSSFRRETGLAVDVALDAGDATLPREVLIVVYRMIYESLHNARKHADGRGMEVATTEDATHYVVTVENAVDPAQDPGLTTLSGVDLTRAPSIGSLAMRKRANLISAEIRTTRTETRYAVRLHIDKAFVENFSALTTGRPA